LKTLILSSLYAASNDICNPKSALTHSREKKGRKKEMKRNGKDHP
jgi:hypothetical protein